MAILDYLQADLDALEALGRRRRIRPVDSPQGAVIRVDGRGAINFSSNNYLSLANSPLLLAAARNVLETDGFGAGASRLIVGSLRPHRRVEEALAAFHRTEAALVFNSGYHANVGLLSALAGPEDVIFSDALNHASIIDGTRLSRANTVVYRHRDTADLASKLHAHRGRRRFIVSDSIFSMDGDLAPLVDLRRLSDQHQTALILDEAHATGVVGPQGCGLAAQLDIVADVAMGTLSKALGGFGGYVAGSRALVDVLTNRARSFVFTTALPTPVLAAAEVAIAFVASEHGDELRAKLAQNIERFAQGLRALALLAPGAGTTPIFPIHVGSDAAVMDLSERLLAAGIFAQGIRPPTVPAGTARLRFALMATHTPAQLDRALEVLADLRRDNLVPPRSDA